MDQFGTALINLRTIYRFRALGFLIASSSGFAIALFFLQFDPTSFLATQMEIEAAKFLLMKPV